MRTKESTPLCSRPAAHARKGLLAAVCLAAFLPGASAVGEPGNSGVTGVATPSGAARQQTEMPPGPGFADVVGLRSVGSPIISPDGRSVAYTVRQVEWDGNRYDTEIWLSRDGDAPIRLTNTPEGSSTSPQFSPDGMRLAFMAARGEEGRQIWMISLRGGEARPLTAIEDRGIGSFRFSPDGTRIAVTLLEPRTEHDRSRTERYGDFEFDDREFRNRHLFVFPVRDGGAPVGADELRRLTGADDPGASTVGSFSWAPDGARIAYDHRPDPLIETRDNDISIVDVAAAETRALVQRDASDSGPRFSPDGARVLFSTDDGDPAYYTNSELAWVATDGGEVEILTGAFDENPRGATWLPDGSVVFGASLRMRQEVHRLDAATREITPLITEPEGVSSFAFAADGKRVAIVGVDRESLPEIYVGTLGGDVETEWTRVSDMSAQVSDWDNGTREAVQWASRDGAEIEGVLYKPANFMEGRRYPLFVVIHGGPTGTSRPRLVYNGVYPVAQWLAKGALVLMPNYRGSAGYGEAFRSLNVRNLGVGDAWDVETGVEHLVAAGLVDPDRVAAMGWSQGGYISAFLATTSTKFRAISVGAGISNWMTYYVNTDIHPFTRHYLQATPWEDPEIYAKTSPMTYVNDAATPTLIQHGEFDRRVPIPNAYELLQGLRDVGVEAELVVYKGFGHGIDKPKERLAAVWHNWIWFARHMWDEVWQLPID